MEIVLLACKLMIFFLINQRKTTTLNNTRQISGCLQTVLFSLFSSLFFTWVSLVLHFLKRVLEKISFFLAILMNIHRKIGGWLFKWCIFPSFLPFSLEFRVFSKGFMKNLIFLRNSFEYSQSVSSNRSFLCLFFVFV